MQSQGAQELVTMTWNDANPIRHLRAGNGTVARRAVLGMGGLAGLSLFWSDWLRVAAAGTTNARAKAKAVILIFNAGAPSHLDLWDMKPDAPETIRGIFKPVATRVPGLRVSELMPRVA